MTSRWHAHAMMRPRVLPVLALLCAVPVPAVAADTCECADIADLRNREAEERAAIQAYRDAIARWGSAPPVIDESARTAFQDNDVQPAINAVTTQGTNKARGVTDPSCRTTLAAW